MKKQIKNMLEIGKEVETQDNRCTNNPLFIVFQKEKQPLPSGFDGEGYYWISGYSEGEIGDDEDLLTYINDREELKEEFEKKSLNIEDESEFELNEETFTKYQYKESNRYVQTFFTEKAAERYIEENAHNLRSPFSYAASTYRNKEMVNIREFLLKLTEEDRKK